MRCGLAKPTKEAAPDPESGAPGDSPGARLPEARQREGAGSVAVPFSFLDHTCPFTTVHLKHIVFKFVPYRDIIHIL